MQPEHWRLILEGFPETEKGDVYTKDGEFLGTWFLVDDVFYAFTPDGASQHLFFDPFLGSMVSKILEWHAGDR